MNNLNTQVSKYSEFIWKIADLLRGDYKQSEYGDVILPFIVLARLDTLLIDTKDKVLELHAKDNRSMEIKAILFNGITKQKFYNYSKFNFSTLKNEPDNLAENLKDYILSFSENVQDILDSFDIFNQITRLHKSNLLYKVVTAFSDPNEIDLSPKSIDNNTMGYIFEELIRKFSEMSNETAGEHFTPREVIDLMVSLMFSADVEILGNPGHITSLYDPAVGTGGMLAIGTDYLEKNNTTIRVDCYGQELNEKTYAICKSDMLLKGQKKVMSKSIMGTLSQRIIQRA